MSRSRVEPSREASIHRLLLPAEHSKREAPKANGRLFDGKFGVDRGRGPRRTFRRKAVHLPSVLLAWNVLLVEGDGVLMPLARVQPEIETSREQVDLPPLRRLHHVEKRRQFDLILIPRKEVTGMVVKFLRRRLRALWGSNEEFTR